MVTRKKMGREGRGRYQDVSTVKTGGLWKASNQKMVSSDLDDSQERVISWKLRETGLSTAL